MANAIDVHAIEHVEVGQGEDRDHRASISDAEGLHVEVGHPGCSVDAVLKRDDVDGTMHGKALVGFLLGGCFTSATTNNPPAHSPRSRK